MIWCIIHNNQTIIRKYIKMSLYIFVIYYIICVSIYSLQPSLDYRVIQMNPTSTLSFWSSIPLPLLHQILPHDIGVYSTCFRAINASGSLANSSGHRFSIINTSYRQAKTYLASKCQQDSLYHRVNVTRGSKHKN